MIISWSLSLNAFVQGDTFFGTITESMRMQTVIKMWGSVALQYHLLGFFERSDSMLGDMQGRQMTMLTTNPPCSQFIHHATIWKTPLKLNWREFTGQHNVLYPCKIVLKEVFVRKWSNSVQSVDPVKRKVIFATSTRVTTLIQCPIYIVSCFRSKCLVVSKYNNQTLSVRLNSDTPPTHLVCHNPRPYIVCSTGKELGDTHYSRTTFINHWVTSKDLQGCT